MGVGRQIPIVNNIMSRAGWGKSGILVLGLANLGGGLVYRAGVQVGGELVGPEGEELVGPEE